MAFRAFNTARAQHIALQHGCELQLQVERGTVFVAWIARDTGDAGAGETVLRAVCKLAASSRRRVELVAMCGRPRLVAFYERLGFLPTGETDGCGAPYMVWDAA